MSRETTNYWRRKASRRDIVRAGGLTGAGVLAAGLVGCGDDDKGPSATSVGAGPTRTPDTATARRGGELNLLLNAQVGSAHPQMAGAPPLALNYSVYDHLVVWDYNNDKPDFIAAESYETPEPTRLIYHIRPQAKVAGIAPLNGRTVTSQDVDISWKNYIDDPKTNGAKAIHQTLTDRRETPAEKTLVQVFKAPSVNIFGPHGIAAPIPTVFMPPELWANNSLSSKAIGSGPYEVEKFDGTSEIVLTRRKGSWGGLEPRPYIDKIRYKYISDVSVRAAALKSGDLHSLVATDKVQADEFKGYGPHISVDKELFSPRAMLLNAAKPPFNDMRVRKAIYAALDIKDLIDRVDLGEGVYSSFVPPFLASDALPESEIKSRFPNDKKAATQMLSAAGWNPSTEVEFKFPTGAISQLLVETIQQQLLAVGFKTKLVPQDPSTVWSAVTLAKIDYTMTAAASIITAQDADLWLAQLDKSGGGTPKVTWTNPEYDAMFAQSRTEFNRPARHDLLLKMQRKLYDDAAPWVNLYSPYLFTGRWKKYHPVLDTGYAGQFGQYHWMET